MVQRKRKGGRKPAPPNPYSIPMPRFLAGMPSVPRRRPRRRRQPQYANSVLNPLNPTVVPSMVDEGNAVVVNSKIISTPITTAVAAQNKLFLIANVGHSGTGMLEANIDSTPTTAVYGIPMLSTDTVSDPTSGRAAKCSVSIQCLSTMLNVGGVVHILKTASRFNIPAIASSMNETQWNALGTAIVNHPDTRTFTCHSLLKRHTIVCGPRDQASYASYRDWDAVEDAGDFMLNVTHHTSPSTEALTFPMEAVWIWIPKPDTDQTFQIHARLKHHLRFGLDPVVRSLSRRITSASQQTINKIRDSVKNTTLTPDTNLKFLGNK